MPPTSDLLHQINQQHATAFVLLDRYTTGEQGAFALVDAKDDRLVLKWAPDLSMLTRFQRARQVTDQLRMLGYPAPEYVLVGCTADAALWQTILKHSGPEGGAVYLAHLIHRQVDWSIRYHTAEAIEHWLRIAAAILDDLAAYR
jgi:hypothetical protein